ncbi:MAG: hypothetical protein ACOX6M_04535 [Armatimonadota bacterium]|jgi:hypothetical protein
MITSRSLARNTKLWAACGVLAIVSLSLVLAAGCASGGSPAQTQLSGSAKMHTYNAAPADEVGARFFYSNENDDLNTPWNESRTVWSTAETTPSVAANKIGLETAPYSASPPHPFFNRASSGPSDPEKWIKLSPSANVYIVNNWSKPITITAVSAPEKDLFYRLPTMDEINAARMGQSNTTLYQWLLDGPGLYASECAPFLFPNGASLIPDDYEDGWKKAFFNATYPDGIDGTRSKYLLNVNVNYTAIQNETIAAGSRSSQPMKITLNYAGVEGQTGYNFAPWPWDEAVAIAFSTYFGVTVDFTYPPDP